jgi:hypothetical protein
VKLVRIVNVLALAGLLGSATVAYRVKYDATLHAEEVSKLKRSIDRERDSAAVLKAEIARRIRPDRIQVMAERHLDYEPFSTKKLLTPADLPVRPAPVDLIAQKLEMLGLSEDGPPKPAKPVRKGAAP